MPETQNTPSNDAKPDTAETKVCRALESSPGTTAAQLASAAGVGRSTATKILSRWANEGLVTRTTGKDQSVPVTWTMSAEPNDESPEVTTASGDAAEADEGEADPSPVAASDPSASADPAGAEVTTAATPKKDRLPKGALYELVQEFLNAHPDEEFGPAKIGTELSRSSGAVNNALEKLVINGLATKTREAPKRFTSS
jgi:predicted transcriptional regulator